MTKQIIFFKLYITLTAREKIMGCCQVNGIEEYMDTKLAAKDLKRYQKKGPDKTTSLLLSGLIGEGVAGLTLLDIGGGVGVLQHELLKNGAAKVISVDASSAYLEMARKEAHRQGHSKNIEQHHGDFVEMEEAIDKTDIVTLDRVICCYDNMERLVKHSASHALKLYGVVYPGNHWLIRFFTAIENLYLSMKGSQFRIFNHNLESIEKIVRDEGLERFFTRKTLIWRIHVYRRRT